MDRFFVPYIKKGMVMQICLLGHDAAPSGCFEQLSLVFASQVQGSVRRILGFGKPFTCSDEEIRGAILLSDFVLLGMSSSPTFARMEIKAGEWAKKAGIPYGFYSDAPFAVGRARKNAWFGELAKDAKLVLGLMSSDVGSIFPNAKCVPTGNPLREDMMFPTLTRNESRSKIGIHDDQILIHAVGGKFAANNMATWVLLLEALENLPYRDNVVLVITPHPGDPTLRAYDKSTEQSLPLYEELCTYAPVQTKYITRDIMTTSEVLAGADLVVEYTGSASIEAAYRRIPAIAPLFQISLNSFEVENGTREIEAVGLGTSIPIYNGDVCLLRDTVVDLLDTGSALRRNLLKQQEEQLPLNTARGSTLSAMATAIADQIPHAKRTLMVSEIT